MACGTPWASVRLSSEEVKQFPGGGRGRGFPRDYPALQLRQPPGHLRMTEEPFPQLVAEQGVKPVPLLFPAPAIECA